jgi:predicted transposase YdaD
MPNKQEDPDDKGQKLHNALFLDWFARPEAAGLLFAEQMPERLLALFKPGPPKLIHGSFVDPKGSQRHTDLLFEAPLKKGGCAYVYVLVEHKSAPERGTPLQLLRYKYNIWSCKGEAKPPLTPIVPLVVYHGARPWNVGATFHDMFDDLDDELRPLTDQFRYVLIDLGRIDDENLSRDLRQRAHLAALKYNTRPDMRQVGLQRVARLLVGLPEVDVWRILRYILLQHADISKDDLDRALSLGAPERKDKIMNGFLQEIEAKGEAKGRAEGEAKGRAETLLKQLSHRFGRLPRDVERRVREADAENLDRWALRVLDARSLKDVFGS